MDFSNTRQLLRSSTIQNSLSEWVPVHSPESEYDLCRTPSTDEEFYSASPSSANTNLPSKDELSSATAKLASLEHDLESARAIQHRQSLLIDLRQEKILALTKETTSLESSLEDEKSRADRLGTKLLDLFIVLTQNQQRDIDELQKEVLKEQTDAEKWQLGDDWQKLQQQLHSLNRKLDDYINSTAPHRILAGDQTQDIKRDENESQSENDFAGGDRDTHTHRTRCKNDVFVDAFAHCSVADILSRYYYFSCLGRERIAKRGENLQMLLDKSRIEIARLQGDLTYEKGRAANMKTRLAFWKDDLVASNTACPIDLRENLEMKEAALQRGLRELEETSGIIQKLPAHCHIIGLCAPDEVAESMTSTSSLSKATKVPEPPVTPTCVDEASQRRDKLYIAELETKLKEKQADEKAWVAHFETLHQRQRDAEAAIRARLNSIILENEVLGKAMKIISDILFKYRERL